MAFKDMIDLGYAPKELWKSVVKYEFLVKWWPEV